LKFIQSFGAALYIRNTCDLRYLESIHIQKRLNVMHRELARIDVLEESIHGIWLKIVA
jgi:hypothetical protein